MKISKKPLAAAMILGSMIAASLTGCTVRDIDWRNAVAYGASLPPVVKPTVKYSGPQIPTDSPILGTEDLNA